MKQQNSLTQPLTFPASAPIRSMTGFARVSGIACNQTAFVLTLKSVNHRYLDLQFHLPNGMDALEMRWRNLLKDQLVRGHIDVRLSIQRAPAEEGVQWNSAVVRNYVAAFREAAAAHNLPNEPDLNIAFRLPGAWLAESMSFEDEQAAVETAAAAAMLPAVASLDAMRAEEGKALAEELDRTLTRLQHMVDELTGLRADMRQAHVERLNQKMREMLGETFAVDQSRILQEAALLAERSDVEEEMARMRAHIGHFHDMLQHGGELGKKLDFLLQEMAREANTTLSKTGSIANRSMHITELGLAMKSEIEKAREQVQNIE